ncbi:MAG: HD domain-containing protein [Sedimentisphaerales bacterium]|nr:HD domain-containing protein [Sedimentisphaerales bacterium]
MKPAQRPDKKPIPEAYHKQINAVRQFALRCRYEQGHSEQVTRLAELLFDQLQPLHGFTESERFLLTCGGILHDIGWAEGQSKHHKTSMRMILEDTTMPLDQTQRIMVALIARYHRKALPEPEHPCYGEMKESDQYKVRLLAGMVRLADGLDRGHVNAISGLTVQTGARRITIHCDKRGSAVEELHYGKAKADLLEEVLGYTVDIV